MLIAYHLLRHSKFHKVAAISKAIINSVVCQFSQGYHVNTIVRIHRMVSAAKPHDADRTLVCGNCGTALNTAKTWPT